MFTILGMMSIVVEPVVMWVAGDVRGGVDADVLGNMGCDVASATCVGFDEHGCDDVDTCEC